MWSARGPLRTTRDRTLGFGRVGSHAAAGGYSGCPGGYVPLHYAGDDAANGSARTFFVGDSNQATMQDLNGRLASYMDEVQTLEAANETLEMQIKELLDRKSPGDLIKLDKYLDAVNRLHSQITECQTAEAQTKVQLVSLVLVATDLSARVDAERGKCVHLHTNLRDLGLVGEQLQADTLPGLCRLATVLTEELAELQAQHLQDVQVLRAQVSGDISVQLSCAEANLSQQLEMFRDESLNAIINNNQAQNNYWFNTQAGMLSCKEEETLPSSSSEVFQTEMNNLRMTKLMLEEELIKLQTQKVLLEESDLSLMEGYSMQLIQLQQNADGLGQQLSSLRQATSQQAEEYQALLDIKSSLEREIEDYTTLLDVKLDRTLSSTITSAIPLNVQTSGTALQSTAMMGQDRRILAQTRTFGNGSEIKANESRVHMSSSPSSIRPHQVNLAKDALKKPSASVTSISTCKIQSISEERKGTPTGSQEAESKTSLEMKKQSILLESQVPSQQTPIKNTVIVEPTGVKEITGTTLDKQMTTQVTNTVTEIIVTNTNIQHTITTAAQPETRTISDSFTPMTTAIGSQLGKECTVSTQLSSTSCDTKMSERRGIQSNVCQINSEVPKAALPTGTTNIDIVGKSTVVDLNVSEAQMVTSIERPTEEEIHVGNNTPCTAQGNTQDINLKNLSVAITAVGNHLEEAVQANTDGNALGQARCNVDDAHVKTVVDVRVQMESNTYSKKSTENTLDQNEGTVVKLRASTITKVEDNRSDVVGNVENKADDSFAPQLASSLRVKEEVDDVESATTSHGSSDHNVSINHTAISESNPIPAITDKCTSIEHREEAVKIDNAVPQVQNVEEEEGKDIEEVDTTLQAIDSRLPDPPKTIQQDEQVHENVEVFDREATVVVQVNDTNQETSAKLIESETAMSSVDTVVGCEAVTEVNFSQTQPDLSLGPEDTEMCLSQEKSVAFCITTAPGVSELKCVTARDSDSLLSQIDPHTILNQNEPDPVHTNEILNGNNLDVCVYSEAKGQYLVETCFSPVDAEDTTLKELEVCFSPVDGETLNLKEMETCFSPYDAEDTNLKELEACCSPFDGDATQNELDTCFSPMDTEVMTQNELEMLCLSPVDNNYILRQNQLETCLSSVETVQNPKDLELCLSPVTQEILNRNRLEACMSPGSNNDFLSPNQSEGCFSPMDNNDILSQNELEGCFSPVDNDILSPNELEACFSPVDNDVLSPNELEACFSPEINEAVDIDRKQCFSPSNNVCMSPTEEPTCSPVRRHILSTKVDNQSLSFSGKRNLMEKASKLSEQASKGYSFKNVQTSGYMYTSKTNAGSRDVANSPEGRDRNRSIEGIGQEAFSSFGSPPDHRYRKLSLGDREEGGFHSITRGTYGLSPNKSLDGQKSTGLTASRISPSSSSTNEKTHCFRSVPFSRGASFSSPASGAEGAKAQTQSTPSGRSNRATSPGGRLFSAGSGEWKVYGGSVGRTSNTGGSASGGSAGSGGRLARSGSGDRISRAAGSHVVSGSRRYGSMGSGESRPVYGSASGRISGAVRQSGVSGGNRAPSPGTPGRKPGSSTGGSGGRLSMAYGGSRMSGAGSGGKHSLSGSSDRLSGGQGLRISSSAAGQVRINSTGGRVISSSDRPAISAGSGVGSSKERISVCKRAALSISAAGRERSQEKHRSTQQMASANNPRIQHWVTTGIGGAVEGLDDQDDILNL